MATSAMEGWHPRQLGHLSDEATELLVAIMALFEKRGYWCTSESELLTRLIPKSAGGFRPIALYASLFRV